MSSGRAQHANTIQGSAPERPRYTALQASHEGGNSRAITGGRIPYIREMEGAGALEAAQPSDLPIRVGDSPVPDRDFHPVRDANLAWRHNARGEPRPRARATQELDAGRWTLRALVRYGCVSCFTRRAPERKPTASGTSSPPLLPLYPADADRINHAYELAGT
jgi:hypothetical protein